MKLFIERVIDSPAILHNDTNISNVATYRYRGNTWVYPNNYTVVDKYLVEFKNNYTIGEISDLITKKGIVNNITVLQKKNLLNKVDFVFEFDEDSIHLIHIHPLKHDVK